MAGSILSGLFVTVATIATVVTLAVTILSVVSQCGITAAAIVTAVVSMIVVMALNTVMAAIDLAFDAQDTLYQVIEAVFAWSGGSIDEGDVLSVVIDGVISMFALYAVAFKVVCPGLDNAYKHIGADIAFAVVGLIIAVFGAGLVHGEVAKFVGVVGLVISAYAALSSLNDMRELRRQQPPGNSSPFIILSISATISIAGCIKNALWMKVDHS